jgi:hypothetical protein
MNAFADDKQASANLEPETLLDWTVDIERISRLVREAFLTETPDPWARTEAECLAHLIDAELIALDERQCRDHRVEAAIRHLKALRTQTVLAIKTLEGVERHSSLEAAVAVTNEASNMGLGSSAEQQATGTSIGRPIASSP